jgi:HD-like signal output (HDOD) protein
MIEKVCILQDLMATAELRQVLGSIGEIPSLASTYTSLLQALQDDNASIAQVAKIIEHDMGMSAKILQLVNSSFFGLAQTVTTLRSAVSFLGLETIKNLALATETFRIFVPDARIPPSVCESIQQHTQVTAAIIVALPLQKETRDSSVVAALLHDIGRLVLASKMPDKFCAAITLAAQRECQEFEAEEELLGISHAEIGAYLLGLWGMPNLAVEAIAHHHRPTRISHTGMDSSVAVYVADLLAHHIEDHPQDTVGAELLESDRACLDALGVLPQFAEFRELARQGMQ